MSISLERLMSLPPCWFGSAVELADGDGQDVGEVHGESADPAGVVAVVRVVEAQDNILASTAGAAEAAGLGVDPVEGQPRCGGRGDHLAAWYGFVVAKLSALDRAGVALTVAHPAEEVV
jgi:hypothetical protein